MVCRLQKDLYSLKQAPRAWYKRLHNYLMKIGFEKTNDNINMYLQTKGGKGILLVGFFVDDIIFGGQDTLCKSFANEIKKEFEMSMFGEIKLFIGLQVYQMKYGIHITQSKYVMEILKMLVLKDSKPISKPMVK